VEVRWGRLHNGSSILLQTLLELQRVYIQTTRFQVGLVCRTCFVCPATAIVTARDRNMHNKTGKVPVNITLTPARATIVDVGKQNV
jgi:hypothetical protein